jgi:hypothetical protein
MTRAVKACFVAGALLAMTASAAWATGLTSFGFVGADGSITTCVHNPDGSLRVLDPSSTKKDLTSCKRDETTVTFNQKGEKGDTGATGPAGPQGPPGSLPGPVNVTVDCTAGQSVQHALDTNAAATSIDITIKGTCTEAVSTARDGVTLQAASPGDGIAAPASGDPPLSVVGGTVSLVGLTLTGGGQPALVADTGATVQVQDGHIVGPVGAGRDADVTLSNVTVDRGQGGGGVGAGLGGSIFVDGGSIAGGVGASTGGSVRLSDGVSVSSGGVGASNGGSIEIDGATISNPNPAGVGVEADGGNVRVNGATTVVSGNATGVEADNGGTATIMNGAQITGNDIGVRANGGGHLAFGSDDGSGLGAIITHNSGDGVRVVAGSTLRIYSVDVVSDNGGNGVTLSDTSVGDFINPTITGNGGIGVHCDGPPSTAVERGPVNTVTGNDGGDVDCRNAGQPG